MCASYGFPVTIFLHPEVAAYHAALLLGYEENGHCLGLHLHPYKLIPTRYHRDLGAYTEAEQRQIIAEASKRWSEVIGHAPGFFRAGYFSANDMTFRVLEDLGFIGGSVSIPGRLLPEHQSVWVGAADFPHRADTAFRLAEGQSRFIEVPVSVDYERPIKRGNAGEVGYEWPYIASLEYDFQAVVPDIISRFSRSTARFPVFVMDVHNDQDFQDPEHPAAGNLRIVLDTLLRESTKQGMALRGVTLDILCTLFEKHESASGKL
jgi:peptidoglycan/xylan/chitin deacetylase (PgdA/CDA1 family)